MVYKFIFNIENKKSHEQIRINIKRSCDKKEVIEGKNYGKLIWSASFLSYLAQSKLGKRNEKPFLFLVTS